jgi:hypothetical protein
MRADVPREPGRVAADAGGHVRVGQHRPFRRAHAELRLESGVTVARPRKPIDPGKVERLASLGLTVDTIAFCLDCSDDTLYRRYAAALKAGRSRPIRPGDKELAAWIARSNPDIAKRFHHRSTALRSEGRPA